MFHIFTVYCMLFVILQHIVEKKNTLQSLTVFRTNIKKNTLLVELCTNVNNITGHIVTEHIGKSFWHIQTFLSGHIFSSTSQRILSLAMQRGKYLLEWRIHPLHDSAVMSSHAASMAASRVICACGRRSYTFHLQAEKNSSIGLREGDIQPAFCYVLQTTVWPDVSGENWHYPTQQHICWVGLHPSHSQGLCPCKECLKKSADVVYYCIWTKTGGMGEDAIVWDGCTHCNIPSALAWDISGCSLSNAISSTPSTFGQIETRLINVYECVQWFPGFQLQYTLYRERERERIVTTFPV